jgi:hypothetical protein
MPRRLHNRWIGFVLASALGCVGEGGDLPPLTTTPAQRPAFDSQRAFSLLEAQVAFGPRVPGREGHRQQLDWMLAFLEARAEVVVADTFSHITAGGDTLVLTNVVARFRPGEERRILLLAHWDTRPWSDQSPDPEEYDIPVPGANDGASGSAVLLELATLFGEQAPPLGVDLLFTDGEDYGPDRTDMFLGARHFARTLPLDPLPIYGVLLDMVADRSASFPVEGYSARHAPEVVRRIWKLAAQMGYGATFPTRTEEPIMDDHLPLIQAGIPVADIIDFVYGPDNSLWHTPRDVPENTSAETLGIVGEVVAELVYRGG